MYNLLDKAIVADREILGEHLLSSGLTIGTAESCTGGNIAHLITSIAGSSEYFKGGIVSYSNEVKCNILKVSASNIEKDGAVSCSVVTDMAKGAQKALNVDCAIAVSGIAGPGGGTDEKPVGTVWIATAIGERLVAKKYQMGKNRDMNIIRASNTAMMQLLEMLNE